MPYKGCNPYFEDSIAMKRVGVDVGGTFTDLIYVDEDQGEVVVYKLPSTPADPLSGHA